MYWWRVTESRKELSRQNWILLFRLCDLDFNTFCNLSRQLGFRHQHSPLSFQPFLSVGSCCACACGIRFTSFHFQDSTWQLSTFSPPWVGASGFPQPPALLETRPPKSYLSNVLFLQWVWVIAGLSKASATWRQRVNTTSNYNHYYSYCQTIVPISFRYLSDMQDTGISKDVLHKLNQLGAMFRDVPYGSFMWGTRKTGWKTGRESSAVLACLPSMHQYAVSPCVPVMSGLRVESRPASATAAGAFPASGSAASAFLRFEISARGFLSARTVPAYTAYLSFPTSQNSLTAKVSASTGAGGGMLSSHNHFSKVNFDISNKVQQTRTWLSVHMVALTCRTASLDLLTTTIGPTSAASPFALQRNAIKIHLTTWTRERISSLVFIRLTSFVGLSLCPVPGSRAWPAFNAAKAFSAAVLEICERHQYMLSTSNARSATGMLWQEESKLESDDIKRDTM